MHNPISSGWPETIPSGPLLGQSFVWGSGWIYYMICSVVFLFLGLAMGYFIWRRGLLQTYELQQEVRRAEQELENIKDEVAADEKELR
jgi:sensor histidine kinase YesM